MSQYKVIDEAMIENDELTAYGLYNKLCEKFASLCVSVETVHYCLGTKVTENSSYLSLSCDLLMHIFNKWPLIV